MSESKNGVPKEFYHADSERVVCETVADVIEQLNRLPSDLQVNSRFGNGIQLIVYNISDDPHLEFEESEF